MLKSKKIAEESPPTTCQISFGGHSPLQNKVEILKKDGNRTETKPLLEWNDGCEADGDNLRVNLLTSSEERIK